MSQQPEMLHATFKSLEEECEREVFEAQKDPSSSVPFAVGMIEEFDPEELRCPSRDCNIFVAYGVVFSHSNENPPHYVSTNSLSAIFYNQLINHCGIYELKLQGGITIDATNMNECHARFGKKPDQVLALCPDGKKPFPLLAVEVNNTHQSLDMLLRIAEILLNQDTTVNYVLLLDIVWENGRIVGVRFILCRRLDAITLQRRQADFNGNSRCPSATGGLSTMEKFGACRVHSSILQTLSLHQLEAHYQLIVDFDVTINRNDIQEPAIVLDEGVLFAGTPLANEHIGQITIVITPRDLESIFRSDEYN